MLLVRTVTRAIAAAACLALLSGQTSIWKKEAPSNADVVLAAQEYYAKFVFTLIDFTDVSVIEHGSFAMLEAVNGKAGIEALLRKDRNGWHMAIPGKDVVPDTLIDAMYRLPKAVTRALVSANCRSPRWYHPEGDPPSVILRSYWAVAPARELVEPTQYAGPRHFHIKRERYRVCVE